MFSQQSISIEVKSTEAKTNRFVSAIQNDTLNLSTKGITDKDITEIISLLDQHPEVKIADLRNNKISDDGLIQFARENQFVMDAYFDANEITDRGLEGFARENKQISELRLTENHAITDAGVKALQKNTTLLHINVTNNDKVKWNLAKQVFDHLKNIAHLEGWMKYGFLTASFRATQGNQIANSAIPLVSETLKLNGVTKASAHDIRQNFLDTQYFHNMTGAGRN